MIDIRAVSKIFLDFIYDNDILPRPILCIINDSEKEKDSQKHIKYDISVILNILRKRDEYAARNDFYSTYNMLKSIQEKRNTLSERELDTPIYEWLNEADNTLDMLINIRNDFFHDVSKKMDGDTFLDLIMTLIKHVPEGYERDEYLEKLEKFKSANEALGATKTISNNDFIQNPKKEFFINGKEYPSKEFAKYLQNANRIVNVTIFYSDKDPKNCIWRVSHFSETSDLNGNLNGGFLRGWKDKGITGIRLELNK